jgi:hypothetical protein
MFLSRSPTVGPSNDWMVKVIDACTALINSQGV